jgi:hypothetical protein
LYLPPTPREDQLRPPVIPQTDPGTKAQRGVTMSIPIPNRGDKSRSFPEK